MNGPRVPLSAVQLHPFEGVEREDKSLTKARVFLPASFDGTVGWLRVHLEDRAGHFLTTAAADRAELYRKLAISLPMWTGLMAFSAAMLAIPFYHQLCAGQIDRSALSACPHASLWAYPAFRWPLLVWLATFPWALGWGVAWMRDRRARPVVEVELPEEVRLHLRRVGRQIFRIATEEAPEVERTQKAGEFVASQSAGQLLEVVGEAAGGKLGKAIGKHGYRAMRGDGTDKAGRIRAARLEIMRLIHAAWEAESAPPEDDSGAEQPLN